MMVNNVKKSRYFIKKYFSKLKNAEGTKIMRMVETLTKYLISSVTCVDVLELLDLLDIFDLHRIEFV